MIVSAGIDVGSTYTKAVILGDGERLLGRALMPTGYKLEQAAERVYEQALAAAGVNRREVAYVVSTGYGRFQVPFRDAQATDLTAHARGAHWLFPTCHTVLDVGGQTMKATRLDGRGRVLSFRLNDKCAAGTGAFLEKTARYLGYSTEEIGPLALTAKHTVPISGVCAVFAESEVINHVSSGASPAEIMLGSIASLVERSVQLLRRVRIEPDCVLVGGILRFEAMARQLAEKLGGDGVRVPAEDLAQFNGAVGAAVLAQGRARKLATQAVGSAPPQS